MVKQIDLYNSETDRYDSRTTTEPTTDHRWSRLQLPMDNQQCSMRYVRSNRNNDQSYSRGGRGQTTRASVTVGRGRGRGRSRGDVGVYGGRGRVQGQGCITSTYTGGNKKWVRAPCQDRHMSHDELRDLEGCTTAQHAEAETSTASAHSTIAKASDEYPILERRGAHKLVTKRVRTVAVSEVERSSNNDTIFPTVGSDERLEEANNSPDRLAATKSNSWRRQSHRLHNNSGEENNIDTTLNNRSLARRRTDVSSMGPRRICLNSAASLNSGNDASEHKQSTAREEGDGTNMLTNDHLHSDPVPQKTLTDFCYRDTGRGGGRGSGRGRGTSRGYTTVHGGRAPCGKNMGLVRVKPNDLFTTPICPTFARGLQCNNVKCTLRHDVSTEASRPICVFFQRNGMCSKGDECPFRHVKVRWDAEICPSFSRVGYCEDPTCLLRHAVTKKPRIDV